MSRMGIRVLHNQGVRADIAACGILVTDASRANTLRFAHKSFMEYLVAEVIANRICAPRSNRACSNGTFQPPAEPVPIE